MTKRALALTVAIGITVTAVPSAGARSAAEPTTTRHLHVATSASADAVAPGGRVSLVVEITPKPNMHVYAPGQKDFIPVSLTLASTDAVKAETAQFPAAEKLVVKDLGEMHLVYSRPFRIVQDVTIATSRALINRSGTRGASLTVKGTLKYQACDNTICYAPVSVPVTWTLALQGTVPAPVKKH
jgi:DsbC/DsbD-like thiol-disulfide interchange protein